MREGKQRERGGRILTDGPLSPIIPPKVFAHHARSPPWRSLDGDRASKPRPIRKFKPYADAAIKAGVKVYFLNIGDPDIPTPKPILDSVRAFNDPILRLRPGPGLPGTAARRSRTISAATAFPSTADNVIITNGGSEAILLAFATVGDPGDEVIIPEPFYTNYNGYASLADLKVVPLTLKVEDGYRLPPAADFEAKITPRTRAIVLCSPNNPTGSVYSHEELRRVVDIAKKHDLFLIGDEVYKEFVYDGLKHMSLMEFPRTSATGSSSSTRSPSGSAAAGPASARSSPGTRTSTRRCSGSPRPGSARRRSSSGRPSPPTRWAWATSSPSARNTSAAATFCYEGLSAMPGRRRPQAAGRLLHERPPAGQGRGEVRTWMLTDFRLDKATVMVAPEAGFYATPGKGLDEVRIAYVLKEENLVKALKIFRAGLDQYKATVEK